MTTWKKRCAPIHQPQYLCRNSVRRDQTASPPKVWSHEPFGASLCRNVHPVERGAQCGRESSLQLIVKRAITRVPRIVNRRIGTRAKLRCWFHNQMAWRALVANTVKTTRSASNTSSVGRWNRELPSPRGLVLQKPYVQIFFINSPYD